MCARGHTQEGELRPQLLDRFGLSVQVGTLFDSDQRTQVVLDRMAYEAGRCGAAPAWSIQGCAWFGF